MPRTTRIAAILSAFGLVIFAGAGMAGATTVNDSPPGFWWGTDSSYISVPGSGPYHEPVLGSTYGGYFGMIGNAYQWQGCLRKTVWSTPDANRARSNQVTYHRGVGVGGYWFMAGPGSDSKYNGTTAEATAWGAAQAAAALHDITASNLKLTYPVVFMDVELPESPSYSPAPDNGWNNVYSSACSSKVVQDFVPASLDRATFNGFADYLTAHSDYAAGVYSSPAVWGSIFGAGSASAIPDTYEWTYSADTSSLSNRPSGWCLTGISTCAQFFGGQSTSSKYALMWQFSGGGGTNNGVGDFDQIDANRTP